MSQGYGDLINRLHQQIPKVTNDGKRLQMIVCSATLHSFDVKKMAVSFLKIYSAVIPFCFCPLCCISTSLYLKFWIGVKQELWLETSLRICRCPRGGVRFLGLKIHFLVFISILCLGEMTNGWNELRYHFLLRVSSVMRILSTSKAGHTHTERHTHPHRQSAVKL